MADNASGLPARGKTWFDGTTPPTTYQESTDIEGSVRSADDVDSTTGVASAQSKRSGRQVTLRLVRNVGAVALAPSRVVTWASGYIGRRVDGYCTVDHVRAAGVVDEHYGSGGIPVNDLGWLVVSGPCLVRMGLAAANPNISEGDTLTALTAVSSGATTSGRIQSFNVTSNPTLGNIAVLNRIGRAMSAATTADTGSTILVDVEILSGDV